VLLTLAVVAVLEILQMEQLQVAVEHQVQVLELLIQAVAEVVLLIQVLAVQVAQA
jgi:hypothetical protein